METGVASNHVVRYKTLELNLRTRELYKNGQKLKLQGQPIDVLAMLLEKPGDLVTREELQTKLWPETTYVDFEHGLNSTINRLREALGDHADEPQFIETLPRLGYRLILPLEEMLEKIQVPSLSVPTDSATNPPADDEMAMPQTQSADSPHSRSRPRKWTVLGFTAVIVTLLALGIRYLRRPLPPLRITDNIVQITHDGHKKDIAGTDGIRVYFTQGVEASIAQVGGVSGDIAQVGIAGGDIARLPIELPNARLMDVSPDGSALLVRSVNSGKNSLWSVEIPGGTLRCLLPDGVFGTWSPDGRTLISKTLNEEIVVIRSDGSGAHRVVPANPLTDNTRVFDFAWSPDGSKIRLSASTSVTTRSRLFEMSPDGSGLHELLPGWHPSSWHCCGRWTPDGKFYLFASGSFGAQGSQIWAIDERRSAFRRSPAEPVQLTRGPMRWAQPIPGKDGKVIFVTGNILHGELVRYVARSHQFQPFLQGISSEDIAFSPDGRFVAYVTFPEGILWAANRDGSKPVRLTAPSIHPGGPSWSPDGNQILFASDSEGLSKAYVISSLGETPQPILPDDKGVQTTPNWSPDGRRIVFATGLGGSQNSDIRILDLESHRVDILPGSVGMYGPRWSPKGRFIVGLDTHTWDLKVFDFETQRWSLLERGMIGYPNFSRDGRFIYFMRPRGDSAGIYRILTSGGKVERVVDMREFRQAGWFGFSLHLDPEDAPLVLRDAGSYDIYALTLETK